MNIKEFLKLTEGGKIVFFIFLILGILLFVIALVCHENYRPLTEEFIKLNPFITKPDIQGILVCSVTSLVWPTLLAPLYWYILSCLIILVYKKLREKIGRIKAIIAILILIFSAIIINGMYYYLSEYKTISNQKQTTKDYYQELADKCTDDCCAQSVKTMRENDYKQMPLEGCPKDYQSNQLRCISSYKWCEPKKEVVFTSQEECEQKTGKSCVFLTCDFIPLDKTFEEVCGKDFKKGWIPKNPGVK